MACTSTCCDRSNETNLLEVATLWAMFRLLGMNDDAVGGWTRRQGSEESAVATRLASSIVGMAVMASAASQGNAGTSPFDPV